MAYQRGFRPSTPVGQGRGPVRSAMDNDNFKYSLKDRMAARRADKALASATGGGAALPDVQAAATLGNQPASRLDDSPTPGLDAQDQGAIRYNTQANRMTEQAAARNKSTMSGAFGTRAQKKAENLKGRQDLYSDMQKFGDSQPISTFRDRAKSLGVSAGQFNATAGNIPGAASPNPSAPQVQPQAAAPQFGKDVAAANIASMGQAGATADYFKRKDAEMMGKEAKRVDAAFTKPVSYQEQTTTSKEVGRAVSQPLPASAASPADGYTAPLAVAAPAKPSAPSWKESAMSVAPSTEDYGGKMDLRPRPEKRQETYSANTSFVDPVAEAKKAQADASARATKNNEAIRKRRKAQSTGIFPPDSVAGAAWQWLQNDNFSGAEKQPEKPKKTGKLRDKAKSLAVR